MRSEVANFVGGALAAVLAVSGLTASMPHQAEEVLLKLIAKRDSAFGLGLPTSIPVTPLTFIVGGPLLDPAEPAKPIGRGKTVCTFTDFNLVPPPSANADCRSVYTIEGKGEIHFSSSRVYTLDLSGIHYTETTLAITGGTGDYRTARGDARGVFRKAAGEGISYAIDVRLVLDA